MKTCESHSVKIYCGLQEGYDGPIYSKEYVRKICQEFCNKEKLGVTISCTEYVYVDGNEPGVVIGLINYPRFPCHPVDVVDKAKRLGMILLEKLNQERLTIDTPSEMIMLEKEDLPSKEPILDQFERELEVTKEELKKHEKPLTEWLECEVIQTGSDDLNRIRAELKAFVAKE